MRRSLLALALLLVEPLAAQPPTIEFLHSADPPGLAMSRWSRGQPSPPLWMLFGKASIVFVRHEQVPGESGSALVAYRLHRTASGGTQGFRSVAQGAAPSTASVPPPPEWLMLLSFTTRPGGFETLLWQAPAGSAASAHRHVTRHLLALGWQVSPSTPDSLRYQRSGRQGDVQAVLSPIEPRLGVWQLELTKSSDAGSVRR